MNLQSALKYHQMGFSVIPIRPNKRPYLTTWAEYQKKKPTEDSIKKWWGTWPDANPAIVTGAISNLMVVDVDSKNGHKEIDKLIPDTLVTPTSRTPGGGWHYYFAYQNGLPNKSRILKDVDLRTDGGYIVAPPSRGSNGKPYAWISGLSIAEVSPAAMPALLFKQMHSSTRGAHNKQGITTITNHNNHNISLGLGTRDETLFHIANCLVKGGMDSGNILECLNIIGSSCKPPFPEKEIQTKVFSAFKRIENRKRNLTAEVREWISITWHNISITDALQNITNITNADRPKITVIMNRLVKEGILERVPNKNGVYRKIETDCEPEDWQNASIESLPLWLPFGLDDIAEIQPGSIIVIAGEPNAGKTAALMNIAKENMHKFKVHYFSSELGKGGFKRRADKFPDLSADQWKLKFYPRAANFADVIKQGQGNLNLIDYLEMYDNFYLVSKHLADIYNQLHGAVAVIGLQKNPGQDDGRGGSFTREKPVLSLALSPGRAKITKLKEWREGCENPNHKEYHFKLVDGCRFIKTQNWHKPIK